MENTLVVNEEVAQRESANEVMAEIALFSVNTQQDYNNAAELLKDIKSRSNKIADYWKTLKGNAHQAWKQICDKEKELLAPFAQAETNIKGKMVGFQKQKMEEERLLREEQERWKREEAEKLLKLAVEAEKEGKIENAEYLVEAAQETAQIVFAAPKVEKTPDTAVRKTWKARVINESLVPIEVMGTVIRPVDLSALDKLAKFSKGSTEVPGIEFYEDITIAARTR